MKGYFCKDNSSFGFEPIEREVSENTEVKVYCKMMVAVGVRIFRKLKTSDITLILYFVLIDKYRADAAEELTIYYVFLLSERTTSTTKESFYFLD